LQFVSDKNKLFHYKLLIILFHKVRTIHTAITMRLFFQFSCNILTFYTRRCSCLCTAILLSVQPVWPIVLYVKILLLFILQCRTHTLRLANLIVFMQQSYCLIHSSFTESRISEIISGTKFSQKCVYRVLFHIKIYL
jgi:hypothetical protein